MNIENKERAHCLIVAVTFKASFLMRQTILQPVKQEELRSTRGPWVRFDPGALGDRQMIRFELLPEVKSGTMRSSCPDGGSLPDYDSPRYL